MHDENVRTHRRIATCTLHREFRRPLIVVMDRLNVHRAAVRALRTARLVARRMAAALRARSQSGRGALVPRQIFPALANFVPDDVEHLATP